VVCLPVDSTVFYRGRLPHWIPDDAVFFLTWRLAGSVPVPPPDIITLEYLAGRLPGGKKLSSAAPSGPFWLQDARIASMVANALRYGESIRGLYQLYAWVIMPNHVHAILKPHVELSAATQWLKGRTARVGNRILSRTGMPFWQDESFDHWVRSTQELQSLIEYMEDNPVKAGLVQVAAQWPWSSAA
jgi:REP element-mobilizing transposase RayT